MRTIGSSRWASPPSGSAATAAGPPSNDNIATTAREARLSIGISSRRPARRGPHGCGRLLSYAYCAARRGVGRDDADDAAAEDQHAKDEDDALNDRDPGAELGEVMLHRHQKKRPD